jgi:two-component system cell cycle sensor histidine kinase/response regulator CckA
MIGSSIMPDPLRVLLVEDSVNDATLIVRELRGMDCPVEHQRVEDAEGMRSALQNGSWSVVLCDWSMPKFSALSALALVKESGLDLPFIIVSGTIGEEAAVKAMRAGAHDYVLKGRLARLVPAIERELREHEARREHATERKRAEEALRASEARFRCLWDSGIILISISGLDGKISEVNDAGLRMLGYSRAELLSGAIAWDDITPPEWRQSDDLAREQLRTCGAASPWEKELLRKDGSRVPILAGAAMIDGLEGIAVAVDLTEHKRFESAKIALEGQLRQAQKMEAIGRLAGGIAHDFNNVLSVVLSYADLLLEQLEPHDPMRDDVNEIRNAGQRAADLTRQLLMFSRQQVLQPKVLDLNEVLAGLDKMLQRMVGEDVELVLSTTQPAGRVRADPGSIEQVLMNLVVNARDAMPTGGELTIETANVVLDEEDVRAHLGARPGAHVMLIVSDTGTGMDRATQARIFEPFFTTKEQGKGTGLGLSTVFGIVHQSGGHVQVDSEPGKGTTFEVYLPRVDDEAPAARPAVPSATLRGSETVLLVEDEDQVRVVASAILRRHGYHVLEACNVGEALLRCEQHPGTIHLLLTDVVMPQMNGPELAKRLVLARPEMRVLCMSGYTDDRIVRHGVLDAEIAYLQKPITPQSLTSKVREVLDAPPAALP